MIEAGTYRARPIEAVLGQAMNGSEQVGVAFELLDDANAGETVTWFGYFTEKTRDSTFRALRYCGWDGVDLADLSGIGQGQVEVELVIEIEADQRGEERERVRWVNRIGGGVRMKHRMTPEQAKAFAARFKRAAPPTNGAPSDGGDIPF